MPVQSDSTSVTITHPSNPESSVKILNFGATVTSWKVSGNEKLWLSTSSKLDGSKAVRGGIPLVFPRFGPPHGNHPETDGLPQHGFARNVTWEFLGSTDETTAQFGLGPESLTEELRNAWNFDFTLVATIKLVSETQLDISMDVENTDSKPFDFNVLFHTYFRTPEILKTSVEGLNGFNFYNKVLNSDSKSDSNVLTFDSEVDRVYKSTPNEVVIKYEANPLFNVESSSSLTDTVTWNPWTETAEKMSDFAPKDGFHQMVCVENGNVAQFTTLEPHSKWNGSVSLKAHL